MKPSDARPQAGLFQIPISQVPISQNLYRPTQETVRRRIANERICIRVAQSVADNLGFGVAALLSRTRGAPDAAFARQIAMYVAHVGLGLSHETIGRGFARDRTTVAHACRVIEDRRDDVAFDLQLSLLEAACSSAFAGGQS